MSPRAVEAFSVIGIAGLHSRIQRLEHVPARGWRENVRRFENVASRDLRSPVFVTNLKAAGGKSSKLIECHF